MSGKEPQGGVWPLRTGAINVNCHVQSQSGMGPQRRHAAAQPGAVRRGGLRGGAAVLLIRRHLRRPGGQPARCAGALPRMRALRAAALRARQPAAGG